MTSSRINRPLPRPWWFYNQSCIKSYKEYTCNQELGNDLAYLIRGHPNILHFSLDATKFTLGFCLPKWSWNSLAALVLLLLSSCGMQAERGRSLGAKTALRISLETTIENSSSQARLLWLLVELASGTAESKSKRDFLHRSNEAFRACSPAEPPAFADAFEEDGSRRGELQLLSSDDWRNNKHLFSHVITIISYHFHASRTKYFSNSTKSETPQHNSYSQRLGSLYWKTNELQSKPTVTLIFN